MKKKKKSLQYLGSTQMDLLRILGYFAQAFIVLKISKYTAKAVNIVLGKAMDRYWGRFYADFVIGRSPVIVTHVMCSDW